MSTQRHRHSVSYQTQRTMHTLLTPQTQLNSITSPHSSTYTRTQRITNTNTNTNTSFLTNTHHEYDRCRLKWIMKYASIFCCIPSRVKWQIPIRLNLLQKHSPLPSVSIIFTDASSFCNVMSNTQNFAARWPDGSKAF